MRVNRGLAVVLIAPFHAARWIAGPHAQTIVGRALRATRGVGFRRERLATPDGDFVELDFADVPGRTCRDRGDRAPIVLLLHGLEGSARSGYAHVSYRALATAGLRPVGLNFRTCSGTLQRSARLYHSGDTADAAFVLRTLCDRFPGVQLGAVGFSLGGNVLLKYLGERGETADVDAAVAVSVPFNLAACADALAVGASRVYGRFLLRQLQAKVRAKSAELAAVCDLRHVAESDTLREFDDRFTAPVHGFRDADDYYARSSSGGFLDRIRTTTLILHSADDPFLPRAFVPTIFPNPAIRAVVTDRGGHVGFVAGGAPWAPTFWAETQAAAFLKAKL